LECVDLATLCFCPACRAASAEEATAFEKINHAARVPVTYFSRAALDGSHKGGRTEKPLTYRHSLEYAKEMLAADSIVFFEVWVDDGEDPMEIAQEISKLGCSTVVDQNRRVVKVFTANPMPEGFGFL
jgi:hypothetical protein